MGKRAAGRRAGGRAVRRGRKQNAQSKYGRGVKREPARAGAGNKPTAGGGAGCGHVHSCPARRCSRAGRSRSGKPAHGVEGLMAPYLRWWAEAGRSQGAVARRRAQIEDHAHEVQQAKPMRETDWKEHAERKTPRRKRLRERGGVPVGTRRQIRWTQGRKHGKTRDCKAFGRQQNTGSGKKNWAPGRGQRRARWAHTGS